VILSTTSTVNANAVITLLVVCRVSALYGERGILVVHTRVKINQKKKNQNYPISVIF
jgi:hypothetical protein